MDPVTAKTLVSTILVFAITLFSLISFRAFFVQVAKDLRAVRLRPAPARAGISKDRDR